MSRRPNRAIHLSVGMLAFRVEVTVATFQVDLKLRPESWSISGLKRRCAATRTYEATRGDLARSGIVGSLGSDPQVAATLEAQTHLYNLPMHASLPLVSSVPKFSTRARHYCEILVLGCSTSLALKFRRQRYTSCSAKARSCVRCFRRGLGPSGGRGADVAR